MVYASFRDWVRDKERILSDMLKLGWTWIDFAHVAWNARQAEVEDMRRAIGEMSVQIDAMMVDNPNWHSAATEYKIEKYVTLQ